MPNHPMPPPYPICEAHAERLAAVEKQLRDARLAIWILIVSLSVVSFFVSVLMHEVFHG